MAIVHAATLTPGKPEVLEDWLGAPIEIVGTYRFDDPAGEVGVEAFVVRRGESLLHVVLTYRAAALEGATEVATLQHSVLGERWVYDGTTDPVALACFERALRGEQEQATIEVWKDGTLVETREPTVRVAALPGTGADLVIAKTVGEVAPDNAARLVATWDGGTAIVAHLA